MVGLLLTEINPCSIKRNEKASYNNFWMKTIIITGVLAGGGGGGHNGAMPHPPLI